MGVISDGSYGAPKGVIYSFPCTCKDGKWSIVQVSCGGAASFASFASFASCLSLFGATCCPRFILDRTPWEHS